MPSYYYPGTDRDVPFTYTTPTWYVGALPPPYPAVEDPGMYLKFAQEDRESGDSQRHLANAFGNAKKALHLRIDMLLYQFGLFQQFQKDRRINFPDKLKLIDDIGILPTTMIRNINRERNELEHEYRVPAKERVDEALDVVRLLYLASDKVLERLMTEAVVGLIPEAIGSRSPAHAILRLEPMRGELCFFKIEPMPEVETLGDDVEVVSLYPRPLSEEALKYTNADSPFKVFSLDSKEKVQWLPIIKWIVALSQENEFRGRILTKVGGSDTHLISTAVTFPFSMTQERGLTEASTEAYAQRIEKEKKEASTDSSPPESSTS